MIATRDARWVGSFCMQAEAPAVMRELRDPATTSGGVVVGEAERDSTIDVIDVDMVVNRA